MIRPGGRATRGQARLRLAVVGNRRVDEAPECRRQGEAGLPSEASSTGGKTVEICEVWAVGERADAEVYAEATARVRAAGKGRPEVVQLGQIIERLGAVADHIRVDQPPPREPVPDWLADRLIYTVGMSREDVAALDLQQAVDLWAEFRSNPRERDA
jgi:hypothetical protein